MEIQIPMTPLQRTVLTSKAETLFVIGGRGSSKTVAIAMLAVQQSMQYAENRGFIATVSGPHFKRTVIPEIHEMFERWGFRHGRDYEYNGQEGKVTFLATGSFYHYVSLDLSAPELKGMNAGWGAVDEAELCTREQWDMLEAGVRRNGTAEIMRGFCNPPPAGHWIEKGIQDGSYPHITSTTYDNPLLSARYIQKMERKYKPGTPLHARWMLGKIGVPLEGAVYPEFDMDLHVVTVAPPFIGYVAGLDFGYKNPTAMILAGLTSDDALYIIGEYYASERLISHHAGDMLSMLQPHGGHGVPVFRDHDAQDAAEYLACGLPTTPAPMGKNVAQGIEMVRRRLVDGKLFWMRGAAPELIREIGTYVWASGTARRDGKDEPVAKDNHACFAAGTMVMMGDGTGKPIESVKAGDVVMTPQGPQVVIGAGLTRREAQIVSVTIGGKYLEVTDDHRFAARPRSDYIVSPEISGEELLPVRQVFQPRLIVGRDRGTEGQEGVPSSCRMEFGTWGDSEEASHSPHQSQSRRQSPVKFGMLATVAARVGAHQGIAFMPGSAFRGTEEFGCSEGQGKRVARLKRRARVAQEARQENMEQQAIQAVHLHYLWQPIRESFNKKEATAFLSLELQDEALPGYAPRLSEKVLQVEKLGERTADVFCLSVPCGAFVLACGFIVKNCDALRYLVTGLDYQENRSTFSSDVFRE